MHVEGIYVGINLIRNASLKLIFLKNQIEINKFNVHGSVHRNNVLVHKSQQDAQVTEFILSDNCSACFGRHYHPFSGEQNNCNYSIG